MEMERVDKYKLHFADGAFQRITEKEDLKMLSLRCVHQSNRSYPSRQLDGNLERGVEIWFENINLKVISMHITFKCQRNR